MLHLLNGEARRKSHYFIVPKPSRDKLSRANRELQLHFASLFSPTMHLFYEWGCDFYYYACRLWSNGQHITIFATLSLTMNHVIRCYIVEWMSLNWGLWRTFRKSLFHVRLVRLNLMENGKIAISWMIKHNVLCRLKGALISYVTWKELNFKQTGKV